MHALATIQAGKLLQLPGLKVSLSSVGLLNLERSCGQWVAACKAETRVSYAALETASSDAKGQQSQLQLPMLGFGF